MSKTSHYPSAMAVGLSLGCFYLLLGIAGEAEPRPVKEEAGPTRMVSSAGQRPGAGRASGQERGVWVDREQLLMGTRLRIRAMGGDRTKVSSAVESAMQAVSEHEALLSSWSLDSELTSVNQSAVGSGVRLSPPLADVLLPAAYWAAETGGAFEPAVGALIDAWEVREGGAVPSPSMISAALSATGPSGVEINSARGTAVRRDPAAWIDAGGFGKGSALNAAVEELKRGGVRRALLDFGGQIMALGTPASGEAGWPVFVSHPLERDEQTLVLRVADVSVATSGASQRPLFVAKKKLSHIIDPRTGQPVPPWGSVTVVSSDPLQADVLATALFVLGPEEGLAWVRDRADVGALFLVLGEEGGFFERWNPAMEQWLVER